MALSSGLEERRRTTPLKSRSGQTAPLTRRTSPKTSARASACDAMATASRQRSASVRTRVDTPMIRARRKRPGHPPMVTDRFGAVLTPEPCPGDLSSRAPDRVPRACPFVSVRIACHHGAAANRRFCLAVGQAFKHRRRLALPGPWAIADNSFLVEEAFNQEPKIVQNIFGWTRTQDAGSSPSRRNGRCPACAISSRTPSSSPAATEHAGPRGHAGQLSVAGPRRRARPACILAARQRDSSSGSRSVGAHQAGLQVNLPFSKQDKDFYFHWDAGVHLGAAGESRRSLSPALAGSAIYRSPTWSTSCSKRWSPRTTPDQPNGTTRFTRSGDQCRQEFAVAGI